ncbi:MAG TPA: alkaline phosphatase family protein, partial [Actinomycetota bacterium]
SPLRSSVPPISAAAWVSFLLGAGPGSHGILDFRTVDARRYEGSTGHVVTSNDYPKRTVFDVAGSAGLRVASVRVPMTFPAWPVNGVLVSGPPTPDDRRLFCEPADLARTLEVGELDIGNRLLEYPAARQAEILRLQLERSEQLALRVFGLERFELTMIAVNTPDNAHHCFWPLLDGTPHNPVARFYAEVDRFVGAMVTADDWDLVVVMSDHGGGPRPARRLAVNGWLAGLALLRPRSGPRTTLSRLATVGKSHRRLVRLVRRWAPARMQRTVSGLTQFAGAVDWPATTAFGVHLFHPFFGVEINVVGREPEGSVAPSDLPRVRREVVDVLRTSSGDLGLPVEAVMTREQAFGEDADPRLPDVVLRLTDDAEGVNVVDGPLVSDAQPPGSHETKAYHSMEGILVMAGRGVRRGEFAGPGIEDVTPTVLRYLGVTPPGEMTGRVLEELFEPGALSPGPAATLPVPAMSGAGHRVRPVSAAEEEEIAAALRGLGYLE